jgi:hypothetical protein
MKRSHSPQRGLSAVAAGASGPLKLLLATGGATERTPLMPEEAGTAGELGVNTGLAVGSI